jgi:DNA-3-methyladenine glycosylase II
MMAVDYTRARRVLARRDPILRDLMREHGPCRLADRQYTDPFKALIRAIVGQQLSTKAAATIFSRFEALFDAFPSPAQVMATPDERVRGIGLSMQKASYLRDLCR